MRRDIEGEIHARRKALADLMHSQVLGQGDVSQAFKQITETASQVLEVERASVWRLVDSGAAIECIDLFERSPGRHSSGLRISAADVPRYFAALQRERAIRAHDARTDKRTSEFRKGYLVPLGITSMLDAPVFLRGKMVGVVCHEHTGRARRWKLHEELLASSFADFVALVLETAAWHEAEDALRVERDALESKVAERTRDLQDSEANLRALVDFSPVAMVLTRIADSNVLLANRRAAAMFDVELNEIQGRHAPQHWVNLAERGRYLEHVFRHGRIDDFEAEMRTASGRTFWAHLSGQRLRFAGDDALLAAIVDVTVQRQARENLLEQATHDPLTGIFNRRHVEDVLRQEVDRAQRHARPLAVAMLDADHFKTHQRHLRSPDRRRGAARHLGSLSEDVARERRARALRRGGVRRRVSRDQPGGRRRGRGAAARRGRRAPDQGGGQGAGGDGLHRPGGVRARAGSGEAVPARRLGAVHRQAGRA